MSIDSDGNLIVKIENKTQLITPEEIKEAFSFKKYLEREEKQENKPSHYNNEGGSLYEFCERNKLNTWEFDQIKRIMRCRKKGHFIEDLDKTIFLINLYKEEYLKTNPELK